MEETVSVSVAITPALWLVTSTWWVISPTSSVTLARSVWRDSSSKPSTFVKVFTQTIIGTPEGKIQMSAKLDYRDKPPYQLPPS